MKSFDVKKVKVEEETPVFFKLTIVHICSTVSFGWLLGSYGHFESDCFKREKIILKVLWNNM